MRHPILRVPLLTLAAALLLPAVSALAQPSPPFAPNHTDKVLYGAADYTEYMPYERLDKDVERMQQADINVVRVGESSCGLREPEDSRFAGVGMHRVIERMLPASVHAKHGTNRNGHTTPLLLELFEPYADVRVSLPGGEHLLAQAAATSRQRLTLKPWDLAIIEEE